MLYSVKIENFFSVGERQVLDLCARKSVDDPLGRLSPIYKGADERAPTVVALFGPNAAGKSNILRSIAFGSWFVAHSFGHRSDLSLPYEKFGSDKRIKKRPDWHSHLRDQLTRFPYPKTVISAPTLMKSSYRLAAIAVPTKYF